MSNEILTEFDEEKKRSRSVKKPRYSIQTQIGWASWDSARPNLYIEDDLSYGETVAKIDSSVNPKLAELIRDLLNKHYEEKTRENIRRL